MKINYLIGVLFLLLQVSSMIYARFIPERFFCWAPFDEHTYYEIKVTVNNQPLSLKQIEDRYKYYPDGWEPRAIHNVFNMIEQYESSHRNGDEVQVKVVYSINGKKEEVWKL